MGKYYFEQDHLQGYSCILDELEVFENCVNFLDVGCGTGWFGKKLKNLTRGNTCIAGIDVYHYPQLDYDIFCKATITNIPFRSETFDGIAIKAVLEHSHQPFNSMKEINRVAKKDATVFISVPDERDKHFWDDYTHVRPYNKKSLSCLLKDSGFEIIEMWYISSFPGCGLLVGKRQKIPFFVKFLGYLGLFRSTINVVAKKL